MQRIVLTGGHGVGKTTILLALEQLGEHVVHEAAGAIRRVDQARGVAFPEDEVDFENKALALHLRREAKVPATATRVFLDRGALDHLAYAEVGQWDLSEGELEACRHARYDLAFIVEGPPCGVSTIGRVEMAFSERLVARIEDVYSDMDIPAIPVPYGPVGDRVRFVLDHVAGVPGDSDRSPQPKDPKS